MKTCIKIEPNDNVVTALANISANETVNIVDRDMKTIGEITALEDVPFGHKLASSPIANKETVYKFGVVIGRSNKDIKVGEYVHVHNLVSIEGAEKVVGDKQ